MPDRQVESVSVEQARRRAKSKQWTARRVLTELETLDLDDPSFIQRCKAIRDELVPGLLQAMRETESFARLHAGLLLLYLGVPEGTEGVIASLRDVDERLQWLALTHISSLPLEPIPEDAPSWQGPPVPLKRELVLAEVLPFLDEPETRTGQRAIEALMKLNLPEADQEVFRLLTYPSRDVSPRVLFWAALRGVSHGALEVAEELLFEAGVKPSDNYWVVAALRRYCQGNQPDVAPRAAELLVRFVQMEANREGNETTNRIANALHGIAAAHHPDEKQVLELLLRSSVHDWRRGIALERLAELEGEAAAPRLRDALSDPSLRRYGASSVAKTLKDKADPLLVDALVDAFQEERRPDVLRELVNALATLGDAGLPVLEKHAAKLSWDDAVRVYWLARGIIPQAAARELIAAGVISPLPQRVLRQIQKEWQERRDAVNVVYALLLAANRVVHFDAEADIVPPDYVRVIEKLIEISQGVFNADSVSQQVDETTGDVEVQFVYNGKAHTFRALDIGDWYDVGAMIGGLNAALKEAGKEERFFLLPTNDQTAAVTFAPKSAFDRVVRTLRIPLESVNA